MNLNVALVHELAGLAASHNKTWAYPSQQTILDRLRKHHRQHISRRTLCRHLAALEDAGWIRRVVRHRRDAVAGWVFRSTLYIILGPCWRLVRRASKAVALVARWGRVTRVAHNVTPSGYKSSPAGPSGPHGVRNVACATDFVAQARRLLSK